MTNVEHYQKLRKELEELLELIKLTGKIAVRELSTVFFEKHPEVENFSWTQYTPYWNDGDECTFSANVDYPEILFFETAEELPYQKIRAMEKEIATFLGTFDEDHFEIMFGNHAQITVTREGVEISEYDHE